MSALGLDALHADPWAERFVDLPSLNAAASDQIESAVRKVREVARAEPQALRSSSLVVLGPPGAGKTHLFARLRRRLGPRAVFVHVRPLVHAPMSPGFLLGEIVQQLGYTAHGASGLPQAHALVGSLLAQLSGQKAFFPNTFLSQCDALSDVEREERLEALVEQVLSIWQEVDESYLRRLLLVPFANKPATRRALLAWLSGRDCDVTQLQRIGATASLPEERAIPALRTLSSVASLGAPIVMVFDQLENLVDAEGPGSRLLAYANLSSELVDSVRGLVLVHMALDSEWSRGIEPALNLSQRSRLLMAREVLALPTPREREELLRLWLDELPERALPYPWPFSESDAAALCRRPGVTPRMLLAECRRALDGEPLRADLEGAAEPGTPAAHDASAQALAVEWEEHLQAARSMLAEASEQRRCLDAARLADGLLACGRFVDAARFAAVKAPAGVELELEHHGSTGRVALLQQASPNSLGSAIAKLTALTGRETVIAIRERAHDLLPTWKETLKKQHALLATGRARWIWLEHDDAIALLALDSLLQGARSGDLTDERGEPMSEAKVAQWVAETLDVPSWIIVRDLLAEPASSQEPADKPVSTPPPRAPSTSALAVLRRLRVASLERVVREVIRVDPRATRASVVGELEGASTEVHWFGRALLGVRAP